MPRRSLVVTRIAPTRIMEWVRIASEIQMKTKRTEMQEPKKFNPEAFHPNLADKGSI